MDFRYRLLCTCNTTGKVYIRKKRGGGGDEETFAKVNFRWRSTLWPLKANKY